MALTGKDYVNITPGRRAAGHPEVVWVAENSSVTALRGAPVTVTSGYVTELASNGVVIYGFLDRAGANDTAAGTRLSPVNRIYPGREWVGTLKATLTQAMIGSVANLVAGSSTWYLDTSTSVSSVAQCYIVGPAEGYAVGDTDPLVYFQVDSDMIQDVAQT